MKHSKIENWLLNHDLLKSPVLVTFNFLSCLLKLHGDYSLFAFGHYEFYSDHVTHSYHIYMPEKKPIEF